MKKFKEIFQYVCLGIFILFASDQIFAAGGGFARVKTWTTGGTLTASDLNTEFDNILTHFTVAFMNGYSGTASQAQSTADPDLTGSGTLATTLSGELERLRYQDNLIIGNTYWYQKPSVSLLKISNSIRFDSNGNMGFLLNAGEYKDSVGENIRAAFKESVMVVLKNGSSEVTPTGYFLHSAYPGSHDYVMTLNRTHAGSFEIRDNNVGSVHPLRVAIDNAGFLYSMGNSVYHQGNLQAGEIQTSNYLSSCTNVVTFTKPFIEKPYVTVSWLANGTEGTYGNRIYIQNVLTTEFRLSIDPVSCFSGGVQTRTYTYNWIAVSQTQ